MRNFLSSNKEYNRMQSDMHRHKDKHLFLTSMNDKDNHYKETSKTTVIFMWVVGIVVLLAIGYAIFFW